MRRLAAVILAAGRSSRLGEFKPLLPLAGRTLLARAVELCREGGAEEALVVTGHRGEEVAAAARELGARPAANPRPGEGMFSSVRTGLQALSPDRAAVFVLPVDLALVRPFTLRRLAEVQEAGGAAVVHPTFRGERGHPPLLSRRVLPRVLAHGGEGGLRGALAALEPEAEEVATFDRNILLDLDTPEALAGMAARAARLARPDPEEAEEVARLLALPAEVLAHGRAVAELAERLARALAARGVALDPELAWAAGLLHDLAKGRPGHAREGARILAELGLGDLAPVVAAHEDLGPPAGEPGEKEVVCLADKLVQGNRRVELTARFAAKLAAHGHDPAARAAILARRERARGLRAALEARCGRSLAELLAGEAS